jgi:hypothetical protein
MYLNKLIKAQSLSAPKLTQELKEVLAKRLVDVDEGFKPSSEYPQALKYYQSKPNKTNWGLSENFIVLRTIMAPVFLMLGIVTYLYFIRLQKLEVESDYEDKDYKTLTARQLKKKEAYSKKKQEFYTILNTLQNQLKDEYQEQLHELQEFVSQRDSKGNE